MNIPISISFVFILLTATALFMLFMAGQKNIKILVVVGIYLLFHGLFASFGFYTQQPISPPKFFLIVGPSFAFIFYMLFSPVGKAFISTLDVRILTLLHTIRIAAELILFSLFIHQAVPEIMTFEGRNFDILAGLSAPIVYYFAFVKKRIGKKILLVWNIVSMLLLINIVVHAALSVELPFQQFGFDQPNRAILQFPYVWLPSVVVPIVLFAHLATIQILLKKHEPEISLPNF